MSAGRSWAPILRPSGECFDVTSMTAADALLAAVGQARGPMAHGVAAQADYGVAAQDGRPVDANEQGWVQLLLQLGDRPIDQPAALSHVEPHIVEIGRAHV